MERGIVGQSGWAYHALGRACLLLGNLDKARSFGERALEASPRHPGFAAHALHLLGNAAAQSPQPSNLYRRVRLDPPPMTCPECAGPMAFNDFPERYFSFLSV